MGKSTSVAAFTAKLEQAAKAVGDTKPALNKAAMATKVVFVAEAAKDGVGPMGRSKIPRAVRVNYKVTPDGTDQSTATVRYTGPAHLLNNPTKAHPIGPKRRRGKKALSIPGVGVFRSVDHPGTRGLHFFQRARTKAVKVAPEVYRREGLREPIRKVFK